MAREYLEMTPVPSAVRTATGSQVVGASVGAYSQLRAQLNVTAVDTPTSLDVIIEDSVDGTNWNTVVTFTQATGTTREVKDLTTPFAGQLRVSWTLVGTSFTFSVSLIAKD